MHVVHEKMSCKSIRASAANKKCYITVEFRRCPDLL
jgi:hypothetical protein